jgi:general secretion pathway protein H
MTLRPEEAGRQSGFTLIEVIVVLVVLGLMVVLVMQHGPMRSRTLETRVAATELAQALRTARSRAIALDRPVSVMLDVVAHSYRVDAAPPRALPPAVGVSVTALAGDTVGNRIAFISFAPDGSSTGGHVDLTDRGSRLQVAIDWLTGRVSIADAP